LNCKENKTAGMTVLWALLEETNTDKLTPIIIHRKTV